VVSCISRPHFTPGKDPVPTVQKAGWDAEPVWTGGKSHLHRNSIPDRPALIDYIYIYIKLTKFIALPTLLCIRLTSPELADDVL